MYKRVLLKVSGEVLGGGQSGLDYAAVEQVCEQIVQAQKTGSQIGVVVGGGNMMRGVEAHNYGVERTTADHMGMLATIINSLALRSILEEKFHIETRVLSAVSVHAVAEDFIRGRALRHLEKGRVVIFGGGTGNPYFSTDTAAVLRAIEIHANIMIKATKVDGVYNKDPKKYNDAIKYDKLSYMEVLNQKLRVLDSTAVSLCMDNSLPVKVLNIFHDGDIRKAVMGESIGTVIE